MSQQNITYAIERYSDEFGPTGLVIFYIDGAKYRVSFEVLRGVKGTVHWRFGETRIAMAMMLSAYRNRDQGVTQELVSAALVALDEVCEGD